MTVPGLSDFATRAGTDGEWKLASRFWTGAGVDRGLLEQQVSLGWGVMALALMAIAGWWARAEPTTALTRAPILAVVAAIAIVCSLSPETAIGPFTVMRPSALLSDLLPMFRSYARFGVVVQLMAVLLAGILSAPSRQD